MTTSAYMLDRSRRNEETVKKQIWNCAFQCDHYYHCHCDCEGHVFLESNLMVVEVLDENEIRLSINSQ